MKTPVRKTVLLVKIEAKQLMNASQVLCYWARIQVKQMVIIWTSDGKPLKLPVTKNDQTFIAAYMNLISIIDLELCKRWDWWPTCRFPLYFEHMEELLLSAIECIWHYWC